MERDYFDLLGIEPTATKQDVKKAYIKKALQFHPDKNGGDLEASSNFAKINEAYRYLNGHRNSDIGVLSVSMTGHSCSFQKESLFDLRTEKYPETKSTFSSTIENVKEEMKREQTAKYYLAGISETKKAQANNLFKIGKYDQAKELYTEAITYTPLNAVLFANRAACFLKMQKYNDALSDCERSINLDELSIKAHIRKGMVLQIQELYLEASKSFERAINIDSKNEEAKSGYKESLRCHYETINNGRESVKSADFVFSEPQVADTYIGEEDNSLFVDEYNEYDESARVWKKSGFFENSTSENAGFLDEENAESWLIDEYIEEEGLILIEETDPDMMISTVEYDTDVDNIFHPTSPSGSTFVSDNANPKQSVYHMEDKNIKYGPGDTNNRKRKGSPVAYDPDNALTGDIFNSKKASSTAVVENTSPIGVRKILDSYETSTNRKLQLIAKSNLKIDPTIITTRKKQRCIIFESNKFVPKRFLKNETTVVALCTHSSCNGQIHINSKTCEMVRSVKCKDHPNDFASIKTQNIISNVLSMQCNASSTVNTAGKILEIAEKEEVSQSLPKMASLTRMIRKSNEINNKINCLNPIIDWKKCFGPDIIMLVDTTQTSPPGDAVIGWTNRIFAHEKPSELFADGLFDQVPNHWKQFYVFSFVNGDEMKSVPMYFFMIRSKNKETYMTIMQTLKNFGVNLCKLNIDFETAVREAAMTVFPSVEIRYCLKHLCTNFLKNYVRFVGDDMQKDAYSSLLRKFYTLSVVADLDLMTYFSYLVRESLLLDGRLQGFVEYVEKYYVGTNTRNALYLPQEWSCRIRAFQYCCYANNVAESMFASYKRQFRKNEFQYLDHSIKASMTWSSQIYRGQVHDDEVGTTAPKPKESLKTNEKLRQLIWYHYTSPAAFFNSIHIHFHHLKSHK